jgi:predicted permease
MIRDLRFALRMLAARPGFTMFAALSLALGIGANSAIFSVVDAIWFRPAGVEHPGRLVRIFSDSPEQRQGMMSYPEFRDLRAQVSALSDVVAVGGRGLTLVEGDNRHLQNLNLVSANFFTALGIHAAAGRLFTPEDDHDSNVTVVLGNAFWRRHYGGDPAVVGRQIRIQRVHEVLATVIGVLPPDFQSLDTGSDRDMWFAEPAWKQLGEPEELEARGGRWFQVAGLLAPHATLREANAQVGAVAQRAAAAYPQTNTGRLAVAVSDLRYRMDAAGTNGLALLGIVLLVIVISSVNVANLLLSRAAARQTEMAIRLSIGADRLRLVRQLMVENVVLGACGVVFGLALGSVIIRVLPSLIVAPPGFISAVQFKLDDRVLVFTLIVGAATVLFFGIAPAWRSSRTDLVPALKGELTLMSTGRHWPLRNWLAVVQVAVSLTLLACAGVVVQSFSNTRTSNLGFQRREILNVWVAADAKPELYRSVVERFQQLPGVRSVAVAVRAPLSLSSNGMAQMVRMPGQLASTAPYEIKYNSVSANFFSTMGTQILRGRAFDGSDENGTANSVLINEKMADRFWPNEQPIGKTFTVGTKRPRLLQVIGVVKNAPINDIGEVPEPYLYLPYWSNFEQEATFMIETDGDAAALLETARKALKSVDARLDPLTIVTMNDLIRFSAQRYQLTAALVSALGIIGLLLTIVGIYGVVSYGVSLRTREFGIRMALGANREATLRQVVREVGILGLVGFALGIPAALFATHAMRALLFGVNPWSATAFAAALATLTASLMIAGMLPAGRATRIEPATALRTI